MEFQLNPQTGSYEATPQSDFAPTLDSNIQHIPNMSNTPETTQTTFKPVATADGITLKKTPFATKKKTLPGGALIYKKRLDLGEGSAVYIVGMTQTEALEMAADAKPMQKETSALDREARELEFEQDRLVAQLEKVKAGKLELSDTEQQAIAVRLLEIGDRFQEIAEAREQHQVESLPMLDSVLLEKIVALEWEEDGAIKRTLEVSDVLEDIELKGQISEFLMGGTRSATGGADFLPKR